jgi:hypothetical protein
VTASRQDRYAAAVGTLEEATAQEVLEAASRAAGAELRSATLRSVHGRPGRSFTRVYDATLLVEGSAHEVLLVAHLDSRPLPDAAFVLACGQDHVAVWRFPHDPFLPGLPSAIDTGRVRELLDRLGAEEGQVTLRTRAYRPSRRAVVEVRIDGPEAAGRILYLKVLAGDRASELAEAHRALTGHLPVPRSIGVSPAQGILALEALPGRTLRQALHDGSALPEPDALVELSSRLAASGYAGRRDPRAFADPRRHVGALQRLVPDRRELVARVASVASEVDGPLVCVHGDLHDGQLLLGETGAVTGVLDIDGVGPGLVAEDAGSLVAHVRAAGEVWTDRRDHVERYAARLADAYRPVVGADALARATAAAWIGLATGPYRAQDPGWQDSTRRRLDRAAAELDGV